MNAPLVPKSIERESPSYKPGRPSPEMDARVLAYTRNIFPDAKISMNVKVDPERGDEYTAVDVDVAGTIEELVKLEGLWCRNLRQPASGFASEYCLIINPQ